MERDFIAMRFYCGQSCENRQQNVKLIVTLSLCTWLGHNIVRTHCVVDTCLALLVGFWGTFRWNVESPHHISQWTPFCDRNEAKRNTQNEAIRMKVIGHDWSENALQTEHIQLFKTLLYGCFFSYFFRHFWPCGKWTLLKHTFHTFTSLIGLLTMSNSAYTFITASTNAISTIFKIMCFNLV